MGTPILVVALNPTTFSEFVKTANNIDYVYCSSMHKLSKATRGVVLVLKCAELREDWELVSFTLDSISNKVAVFIRV